MQSAVIFRLRPKAPVLCRRSGIGLRLNRPNDTLEVELVSVSRAFMAPSRRQPYRVNTVGGLTSAKHQPLLLLCKVVTSQAHPAQILLLNID